MRPDTSANARACFGAAGRCTLSTAPYLSFAGAHLPRLKVPIPLHLLVGRRLSFATFRFLARHAEWTLREKADENSFIKIARANGRKHDDLLERRENRAAARADRECRIPHGGRGPLRDRHLPPPAGATHQMAEGEPAHAGHRDRARAILAGKRLRARHPRRRRSRACRPASTAVNSWPISTATDRKTAGPWRRSTAVCSGPMPREANRLRWEWQYRRNPNNPGGTPVIWIAREGPSVIGQYATMPVRLQVTRAGAGRVVGHGRDGRAQSASARGSVRSCSGRGTATSTRRSDSDCPTRHIGCSGSCDGQSRVPCPASSSR